MTPSIINTESCLVLSPNENGVGLSGQVQQEREDKPESWQALFVCVLRALCTPGFLLHLLSLSLLLLYSRRHGRRNNSLQYRHILHAERTYERHQTTSC
ncbi:MAG: hypothetical protein ACI90V_004747 [Bacillariaceae sp.]|jgi:hypothetical protein